MNDVNILALVGQKPREIQTEMRGTKEKNAEVCFEEAM